MKRIFASLAALAVTTGLMAGVALAHAEFKSATPGPGQTVATSPASVAITFSEDTTTGTTGTVTNAAGATVSTGATLSPADRTLLTIALNPNLPNGVYKVSWHSVANDDNGMLDGTFFFGVGVPAPSTATAPASRVPAAVTLLGLAVALALASLIALRSRSLA
jgi:methionine-rich copper-binding protein CopC